MPLEGITVYNTVHFHYELNPFTPRYNNYSVLDLEGESADLAPLLQIHAPKWGQGVTKVHHLL